MPNQMCRGRMIKRTLVLLLAIAAEVAAYTNGIFELFYGLLIFIFIFSCAHFYIKWDDRRSEEKMKLHLSKCRGEEVDNK